MLRMPSPTLLERLRVKLLPITQQERMLMRVELNLAKKERDRFKRNLEDAADI
jgi:hypothetical protein